LKLDEGKLLYEYAKAFKILAQAIKDTNYSEVDKIDKFESKSFEHQEKTDAKRQKALYCPPAQSGSRNGHNLGQLTG